MAVSPQRRTAADTDLAISKLGREYVAAGAPAWYSKSKSQVLQHQPDDLTQEYGLEVYERMLLDPQIAACTTFWKAAILEEGLQLTPAIADPEADGYERSREFVDEVKAMLDKLPVSIDDVLWDMLNAVAFGNKVAELIYEVRDNKLEVARIKVKPSRAIAMVVDNFLNLQGILGAEDSGSIFIPSTIPDNSKVLPVEKFAILTFRPRDADPRGTSILRPAYAPWWRKVTLMPEYMKFLSQFGGPSVLGFTPEEASMEAEVLDPTSGIPITPEQAMLATLVLWRNGSAAAFPGGSKVDVFKSEGEGTAFIGAFSGANLEITKSILTQELATEQGEYMARAAAQVHQDVLDTLIRQGKRAVVRMVSHQLLKRWMVYNYGAKFLELTPVPTLGTIEQQDLSTLMAAIAQLTRASYFTPEQFPEIDKLLGFPVRSRTAMEAEQDAQQNATNEQPGDTKPKPSNNNKPEGGEDDNTAKEPAKQGS